LAAFPFLEFMNALVREVIKWTLPEGVSSLIRRRLHAYRENREIAARPCLIQNKRFQDFYKGKRCFILCNGPSILKEDLTPLKNEVCFSVSNFYKHPLYKVLRPRYHCVPNVVGHSDETVRRWFAEMHAETLDATLFFGFRQESIIRKCNLFPKREKYFLFIESDLIITEKTVIDLTQRMPGVITVVVMCLMIALYMGFKEIYLLGADHDWMVTGQYHYFFDRKEMSFDDPEVDKNGKITSNRLRNFESAAAVWRQYSGINEVAMQRGVEICNLSQGSYLDVFPFEKLSNVISRK
jgi:hypothetical protein